MVGTVGRKHGEALAAPGRIDEDHWQIECLSLRGGAKRREHWPWQSWWWGVEFPGIIEFHWQGGRESLRDMLDRNLEDRPDRIPTRMECVGDLESKFTVSDGCWWLFSLVIIFSPDAKVVAIFAPKFCFPQLLGKEHLYIAGLSKCVCWPCRCQACVWNERLAVFAITDGPGDHSTKVGNVRRNISSKTLVCEKTIFSGLVGWSYASSRRCARTAMRLCSDIGRCMSILRLCSFSLVFAFWFL